MGHEDQFPPRPLNGRYRLGEATFARASGNDEVTSISGHSHTSGDSRQMS